MAAVVEGNRIRVPLGQESKYMAALADKGALPPTLGGYMDRLVNIGPLTPKDQRETLKRIAIQNQLQQIVSQMTGVEQAAVMYDVEESKGFGAVRQHGLGQCEAAAGGQLDENQVRMIRNLVASSIAGLKRENVTVTDLSGQTYSGGSDGSAGIDDPYMIRKRMFEKQWDEKLAEVLSYIPGVLVKSNVELDVETAHEESHTEFDPKTVPYQQRESSNSKVTHAPAATAGRPGFVVNQHSNQPAAIGAGGGNENTDESNQTETQIAVPNKTKKFTLAGLTPKQVKCTVGIPSSYYEKVWQQNNPTPPGQEPKKPDKAALDAIETEVKSKVQDSVITLLPPARATEDPRPHCQVTTFTSLPGPAIAMPTTADKAMAWGERLEHGGDGRRRSGEPGNVAARWSARQLRRPPKAAWRWR